MPLGQKTALIRKTPRFYNPTIRNGKTRLSIPQNIVNHPAIHHILYPPILLLLPSCIVTA